MSQLETTDINLGYIPLLDCIALLWAHEQGYFKEEGLNVHLVKEASWASLRDRLSFGFLDAAHCLSAILASTATKKNHMDIALQTNLILSQNSAFISLSQKVCHQLHINDNLSPKASAQKIVNAIQSGQKIQFAHVFQQSIHHYILREWLALADADFSQQQRFNTLPPPYMVEAVSSQLVDGFCVGEPWNIQAELEGYSKIIASSQDIIPAIPDKVLAFTTDWAYKHPNSLAALTRAIQKAQLELTDEKHLTAIWALLKNYNIVKFNCSEHRHVEEFYKIQTIIQRFGIVLQPKSEDFEWIIKKMNQWEKLDIADEHITSIAKHCIYTNVS